MDSSVLFVENWSFISNPTFFLSLSKVCVILPYILWMWKHIPHQTHFPFIYLDNESVILSSISYIPHPFHMLCLLFLFVNQYGAREYQRKYPVWLVYSLWIFLPKLWASNSFPCMHFRSSVLVLWMILAKSSHPDYCTDHWLSRFYLCALK